MGGHPNPGIAAANAGLTARHANGQLDWTGVVRTLPGRLSQPLTWRRPRMIFVNSLSDLFHPTVPDDFVAAVFGVIAACPRHTFQILTKRPGQMPAFFARLEEQAESTRGVFPYEGPAWRRAHRLHDATLGNGTALGNGADPGTSIAWLAAEGWPLRNCWLGTSVEDQATADARIPHLLATPAAIRFLSCEPLLGPVDLSEHLETGKLHWVIAGGESGRGYREMKPGWARSLREQCATAGVPFFLKQGSGPRPGMRIDLLGEIVQEFPGEAKGPGRAGTGGEGRG